MIVCICFPLQISAGGLSKGLSSKFISFRDESLQIALGKDVILFPSKKKMVVTTALFFCRIKLQQQKLYMEKSTVVVMYPSTLTMMTVSGFLLMSMLGEKRRVYKNHCGFEIS